MPENHSEIICQGIAASSGYAIGRVCFVRQEEGFYIEPVDSTISESAVADEISHFHAALDAARNEILPVSTAKPSTRRRSRAAVSEGVRSWARIIR